jgi:hypothetical protein
LTEKEPRKEPRPDDGAYYEMRHHYFSQGDIFRDVPRSYPVPDGIVVDEGDSQGKRVFLCGPLSFGMAMLINPTCSMRAQGVEGYAYPSRTLVPLVPVEEAQFETEKLGLVRKYDKLRNYMYLPADCALGIPESLAMLYMPITIHHEFLTAEGQRLTQLTFVGAQQLFKKLTWFYADRLTMRAVFAPPMD